MTHPNPAAHTEGGEVIQFPGAARPAEPAEAAGPAGHLGGQVLEGTVIEPGPAGTAAPVKGAWPVVWPPVSGRPLCPADVGVVRYAVSVAGHGVARTPVAVWDAWMDRVRLANLREGGTHRGPVAERHQALYVKIQAERAARRRAAFRLATLPWWTRAKVGSVPVPVVAWGVTGGELAYAANPSAPLLAATVGPLNGALAELAAGLGALAAPVAGPAALVAGLGAVAHGIAVEHKRRRALLRVRQGEQVGIREDGELLPAMPLADCPHPSAVLEATRRNLAIEGLNVRPVSAQPTGWGWEVVVQLRKGKPADVAGKLAALETLFDVGENGVLMQPHRDRRAQVTLRLIESDPWADMPAVPDYTAGPRRAADAVWLGQRLDGVQVASAFAGKQSIVLAASGGGKSVLLRLIADGLGAAADVHLWDLDPSGVGQAHQAAVMGKTALSPQDCEVALGQALAIASGRTRLLRKLGMGDAWVPSPERPVLGILLDEFPRLTKGGKGLAVDLLRIARKAGVVLIFASQDATKDTLGSAIAGQVAFKAGGPGLQDWQADLLWSAGAKARGWDPGRYAPATSPDEPADAGTFFVTGTGTKGGDLALPMRVGFMPGSAAKARAAAYRAAGRCPGLDAETLAAADLDASAVYTHTDAATAGTAQTAARTADAARDQAVSAEDRRLLAGLAAAVDGDARAWIPAAELADAAARLLDQPAGKGLEMRVARLLDAAGVERDRRRIDGRPTVLRLRDGLLQAARPTR